MNKKRVITSMNILAFFITSAIPHPVCRIQSTGSKYREVRPRESGSFRANTAGQTARILPVSDAAHEAGMKFLLWFATWACNDGIGWLKEHPEFGLMGKPRIVEATKGILKGKREQRGAMLCMDDPEATRFITEHINSVLREHGADYYREDTDPPMGRPDEEGRTSIFTGLTPEQITEILKRHGL